MYKPNNPGGNGQAFPGATVTYSNGILYAWGSKHTNIIVFKDSSSTWHTNTWTWTAAYPYLSASNSLPHRQPDPSGLRRPHGPEFCR